MSSSQRLDPSARPADVASAPDPLAGRRRLVAVLALLLSLGAIGLVSLGSAADRGPETVYLGDTEGSYNWAPVREEYSEPDWSTGEATTAPPDASDGGTALLVIVVVLGIALLLLLALVLYRMVKLARPVPALASLAEEDEELTAVQARDALEEARSQLSTVMSAHDAVIAAWLSLERAIAAAGVRRRPSQTTLEFVVAVLGALELDRSALDRLAHLYRRALFDPEPLVEHDREDALSLLDALHSALDEGAEKGEAR